MCDSASDLPSVIGGALGVTLGAVDWGSVAFFPRGLGERLGCVVGWEGVSTGSLPLGVGEAEATLFAARGGLTLVACELGTVCTGFVVEPEAVRFFPAN